MLCIAIMSGCQKKQSPTIDINYEFTEEEVGLLKDMFKNQNKWKDYENDIVNFLGLSQLDKINLNNGDFAYQFKIRKKYDKYWQLIEIIDQKSLNNSSYKLIRYKIDRDCHPEIGTQKMTKGCLEIILKSSGIIKRTEMDTLNKIVLESEFWELNEQASELRRYDELLYHGDSWGILGAYALQYPLDNDKDTTFIRTHKVNRMIPSDSKIISQIGNAILDIIESNAEDNMR